MQRLAAPADAGQDKQNAAAPAGWRCLKAEDVVRPIVELAWPDGAELQAVVAPHRRSLFPPALASLATPPPTCRLASPIIWPAQQHRPGCFAQQGEVIPISILTGDF
jgi:hypothetical protein